MEVEALLESEQIGEQRKCAVSVTQRAVLKLISHLFIYLFSLAIYLLI